MQVEEGSATTTILDISTAEGSASQNEATGTVYFWKHFEIPYGLMCQWYPSYFRDTCVHVEHTFNCAEQYMMYRKALILATSDEAANMDGESHLQQPFHANVTSRPTNGRRAKVSHAQNDSSRLPDMILAENNPGRQKALARSVRFTPTQLEEWERIKFEVVVQGNYCKFTQNQTLLRQLLATGDRELVEASPQDDVWGIGHAAEFAEFHREHWGSNLLGKALMTVRSRLKAEIKDDRTFNE